MTALPTWEVLSKGGHRRKKGASCLTLTHCCIGLVYLLVSWIQRWAEVCKVMLLFAVLQRMLEM